MNPPKYPTLDAPLIDPAVEVDAPAILQHSRRGWYWVIAVCPRCGGNHRSHIHGGGYLYENPLTYLFHRVAHCMVKSRRNPRRLIRFDNELITLVRGAGYRLVVKDPAQVKAELSKTQVLNPAMKAEIHRQLDEMSAAAPAGSVP